MIKLTRIKFDSDPSQLHFTHPGSGDSQEASGAQTDTEEADTGSGQYGETKIAKMNSLRK